jgi:hypothetical protein
MDHAGGFNRFSTSISVALCYIYTPTLQLEIVSIIFFFSQHSSQGGPYIALLHTFNTQPSQLSTQHAAAIK